MDTYHDIILDTLNKWRIQNFRNPCNIISFILIHLQVIVISPVIPTVSSSFCRLSSETVSKALLK